MTLKDVSRLAGCSTAVASTVLNNARGNTGVSLQMHERVRAAAEKLHYRPDFASRSLARRATQTLGVYVPPGPWSGIAYSYEGKILRGIEQTCRQRGYDLLAINIGGGGKPEDCFHKFAERRIDGLVLLHVRHDEAWVEQLLQQHPNVVAVNYYGPAERGPDAFNFDDHAATSLAVRHLVELGHRRIGYLGSLDAKPGPGEAARYQGFRDAMTDHGLPLEPAWIIDRASSAAPLPDESIELSAAGTLGADHIMSLGADGPTGLVTCGDWLAVHAHKRLRRGGFAIPEQISLVGIDDSEPCKFVDPQLTTIRQPLEEMGRLAAERLINKGEGVEPSDDSDAPSASGVSVLPPELVIRESTGPAPA